MTSLFRLPATTNMTPDMALNYALGDNLADVLILGYDQTGTLIILSSNLTWELNPMFGRTNSPEAIAKGVASRKPYVYNPETAARVSVALKGRKFTEEHKAKISASRLAYYAKIKGEFHDSL